MRWSGLAMAAVSTALLFSGCGGDGPLAAATGDSCTEIADDGVAALNDAIKEMGEVDISELMKDDAKEPKLSDDVQRRLDALEGRANKAGCSDSKMQALFKARADDIEGDGFYADLMRGVLKEGGDFGNSDSDDAASEEETTTTIDQHAPGRRSNPLPVGTAATIGGWSIKVVGSTPNANKQVAAANQFNDEPAPGRQFFLARVEATYEGGDDATEDKSNLFTLDFEAVGDSAVAYSQSSDDCGVVPDELDGFKDVYAGGRVTGNVCWSVESSDVDNLTMNVSQSFGDASVFFALR